MSKVVKIKGTLFEILDKKLELGDLVIISREREFEEPHRISIARNMIGKVIHKASLCSNGTNRCSHCLNVGHLTYVIWKDTLNGPINQGVLENESCWGFNGYYGLVPVRLYKGATSLRNRMEYLEVL